MTTETKQSEPVVNVVSESTPRSMACHSFGRTLASQKSDLVFDRCRIGRTNRNQHFIAKLDDDLRDAVVACRFSHSDLDNSKSGVSRELRDRQSKPSGHFIDRHTCLCRSKDGVFVFRWYTLSHPGESVPSFYRQNKSYSSCA